MPFKEEVSIFFFGKEPHRLGHLIIDAVIKESHELKAHATEHPTESGESFVDHVANLPTTVQLEGVVSNTPMAVLGIGLVQSLERSVHGQFNDLATMAFKKLEDIFAQRLPITISTSLKNYDNMVLESLSVDRTCHTTSSLHFRATAKQVTIVKLATIPLPKPEAEATKPKENLGKQASKPASAVTKQSLLYALKKWLGGLFEGSSEPVNELETQKRLI